MGYHDNDMEVNVDRKNLIFVLTENMGKHKADYEKAVKGFRKLLDDELSKKLEDLRKGHKVELSFKNSRPENHTEDYEDVIGMLELSVDDNVPLTFVQYKQYINDDWDWKRGWSAANAMYLSAVGE